MSNGSTEKDVLIGVIIGFRTLIEERYQLANIKAEYDIPDSFTEERVAVYRDYFLNQIYPHPDERDELNAAFASLDNYISHPEKLLRILFDSTAILLRHGRHIPRLMNAGIQAFRSFRVATGFEQSLVRKAQKSGRNPPYSPDDIRSFIQALRKGEIDLFIENTRSLLQLLNNRALMREIMSIISELISKMKKHPRRYSPSEISGLELGLRLLSEGNRLFDEMNRQDQKVIFDLIVQVEKDALAALFSQNPAV